MPTLVLLWVWFCAYLNCAGWALSALHRLNAGGYAVALGLGLVALLFWRKQTAAGFPPRIVWPKYLRRFRRPFPVAFLILTAMALLGGVIYPPTNYDALAYRLPRVLHWLAADQWHWIHTIFPRVNNRSCGIEWVSAPVLALLKTDRPLFLINAVSFLLLPGLVFSVFTRLGVRRHAAWHWMWIAPTGYCFLLQAGSIGNDLFGAPFALAAVDFALRAKSSRSPREVFASVLAAAMMTSAKTASLPLLLPVAVALLPSLKLMLRWPARTAAVGVIALFASALPTMVLNQKFSGDWSGAGVKLDGGKNVAFLRVVVNTGIIAVDNVTPPVFPAARAWDREVTNLIPARVTARLSSVMVEPEAAHFPAKEMQIEENAGLGFGVSLLVLVSLVASGLGRGERPRASLPFWLVSVRWAPVISLLAVMTQSNLAGLGRILTPYYLLLLPVLLAGAGQEHLVKKGWWRTAGSLVFLMAAGLLVLSPPRPLFPVQTILNHKAARHPDSRLLARMREVYLVYGHRNDGFAPARAILPPGLKSLGLVTYDDPETSLWRPFGTRRIEHVCPGDTAAALKSRGIQYVLLREQAVEQWFDCTPAEWINKMDAQVVQKIPLNLRASSGPLEWDLVKLN